MNVCKDRLRALDILKPQNFPKGCWPAEHPLVWSQQVAINAMWHDLSADGCFAVNGPPGTGKTTLLRDVVAAIIVQRAEVLASLGESALSKKSSFIFGDREVPYYSLDAALSGFSIVVASSNNGAVENVSLELPKANAIDQNWLEEVDFFGDIASEVLNQPAWALIAGRLGNKTNRTEFANKFWWQSSDGGKQVAGMRERLADLKSNKVSPVISWEAALANFNDALSTESDIRSELTCASERMNTLVGQLEQKQQAHLDVRKVLLKAELIEKQIIEVEFRKSEAAKLNRQISDTLDQRIRLRPGFLETFWSLGGAMKTWREDVGPILREKEKLDAISVMIANESKQLDADSEVHRQRTVKAKNCLAEITSALNLTQSQIAEDQSRLKEFWPDLNLPENDQERASPWSTSEWRTARIKLFLSALDLHRSFLERNAYKMMANLNLAMDALQGKVPDAEIKTIALNSLALICPVVSTTFASVSSLFGDLGPGSIGWLLIDEAGQATPQAAAGAIWRARRAVVVGDPLQLDPISTLPKGIQASLAVYGRQVENYLHPSRTSVQMLSDSTTAIGTFIGQGDEAIWVGSPLRVHRRCDEPMFSISNFVAYGGAMVHQKKVASIECPTSQWIDVVQTQSNSNWIPSEGEALEDLLRQLLIQIRIDPDKIFLISPFTDVIRELKEIGKRHMLDLRRVGTVHTAQGKESEIVILVLGGGTDGARSWAAEKPNLLNVAVSRARSRLFVIGNRSAWCKLKYFEVLHQKM